MESETKYESEHLERIGEKDEDEEKEEDEDKKCDENKTEREKKIEEDVKNKVNISDYEQHYSETKFMDKIKNYAKKAGLKGVYLGLILYYALPKLSILDRAIVFGALGYFISPLDLIPDSIPIIGYLDDITILKYACSHTFKKLKNAGKADEEIRNKAKIKLHKYFQDFDESILDNMF